MNNLLIGTNRTVKAPKTGVLIAISVVLALLFLTCEEPGPPPDTTAPSEVGTMEITVQRNASVDITWTDPDDADFSHVLITWDPPGGSVAQPFSVMRGMESAAITGLENGVVYTFSVATVDLTGNISTATAAAPVTATGVPPSETDITNLSRTSSADGTVILLWVDPTGTDFSHVLITWDPAGGEQTQLLRVEKGVQTAAITGLFAGNDYTFSVVHVDTAGTESTPTVTAPVTVMGIPPARTAVSYVSGAARANGSAEITWTDPVGADFSHVLITWDEAGETETQSVRIESGIETATITGLTNGAAYTFSVTAVNIAGRQAGAGIAVLTADTSVNPVTGLSAVTRDNSGVTLSWTRPSDIDLARLFITWTPEAGISQPVQLNRSIEKITILHLTPGIVTTFTVQTVDALGHTASETTTVTATADVTVPSEVTNLAVTPMANGLMELTWDDPPDLDFSHVHIFWGGSPDYAPRLNVNKGIERITLTGLREGIPYIFVVYAVDSTGNRTIGLQGSATANASVPAVTSLDAAAGYTSAGVTWTDPPGISDLSHINITWNPATVGQTQPLRVAPGIQGAILSGLTNGTPYTITATSVDTFGHEATAAATVTPDADNIPVLLPAAPTITADGNTTVTWTDPPAGNGAAKISITGSPNPTTATKVDLGVQSLDFSGLTALGTDYTFTINTLDSSDVVIGTVTATANAATSRPVALFPLPGLHQGNFGFAACNTFLTNDTGDIATVLRNAGYTKAVLFGSKTNDGMYNFAELATDTDALGLPTTGGVTTAKLTGRQVVVYMSGVPITTFGYDTTVSPSVPAIRTINNVIDVANNGGWRNGGYDVIKVFEVRKFWTFTLDRNIPLDGRHCGHATDNDMATRGYFGNHSAIDAFTGGLSARRCNDRLAIICAAH